MKKNIFLILTISILVLTNSTLANNNDQINNNEQTKNTESLAKTQNISVANSEVPFPTSDFIILLFIGLFLAKKHQSLAKKHRDLVKKHKIDINPDSILYH